MESPNLLFCDSFPKVCGFFSNLWARNERRSRNCWEILEINYFRLLTPLPGPILIKILRNFLRSSSKNITKSDSFDSVRGQLLFRNEGINRFWYVLNINIFFLLKDNSIKQKNISKAPFSSWLYGEVWWQKKGQSYFGIKHQHSLRRERREEKLIEEYKLLLLSISFVCWFQAEAWLCFSHVLIELHVFYQSCNFPFSSLSFFCSAWKSKFE